VFTRLFTGGDHDDADQATKLANVRKSVLDAVLADGAGLQKSRLADNAREQHLNRSVTSRRGW
jgi:hypothetical protein